MTVLDDGDAVDALAAIMAGCEAFAGKLAVQSIHRSGHATCRLGGDDPGPAVVIWLGERVLACHASERDAVPTLRLLDWPEGRRADPRGDPALAAAIVLARGVDPFGGGDVSSDGFLATSAVHPVPFTARHLASASRPVPVTEARLRSALRAWRDDPEELVDPHVVRLLPGAARRLALDHIVAVLPPAVADLASVALPRTCAPLSSWDLVVIVACARASTPRWVAQALREAPVLSSLFAPGRLDADGSSTRLRALSGGASVHEVCADLLTEVDGTLPPPVAVRSLSTVPLPRQGLAPFLLRAVGDFHLASPHHGALDAAEVRAVTEVADVLCGTHRTADLDGAHLVRSMLDGGRVVPAPEHLHDCLRSLESSVAAIAAIVHGADHAPWTGGLALRTAFPARRTAAGLRGIDAAWHASAVHAAATFERLRVDVALRRSGVAQSEVDEPFPHVTREVRVIDGTRVTPMLSFADYVAEGADMGHCVGTYGTEALLATIVAFSLRGPGDARSTAAFAVPARTDEPFRLLQHKGPRNAAPDPGHAAVVADLPRSLGFDHAAASLVGQRAWRSGWTTGTVGIRFDELMGSERDRMLALQFADVGLWLSPSERDLGPEGWLAATLRANDA